MNKLIPSTALILMALAATTTIALAAPGGDRAGMRGGADFSELDTNGDGVLTSADLAAAAEERFAGLDADGDGQITQSELAAAADQREQDRRERRLSAMLERFDADSNGTLSLEELSAGDRAGRMLERADADGDGQITQAEFESIEKRGRHGGGHKGQR